MTQQLLIEMPAEGAARLLTLSLLEQLMQGHAVVSFIKDDGVTIYSQGTRTGVPRERRPLPETRPARR